jgi:5-methylcytosine-specific restriction endonuclease McrA
LWFTREVGDVFTLPEAKAELGDDLASLSQHFDRRLRELRKVDWLIPSGRDGGNGLRPEEYRLEYKGARWWIPEERRGAKRFASSSTIRRFVLERDGSRCVLCGVGSRESYPGEPTTVARLTIGHRVPQERLRQYGQRDNLENWRTECARCNEEVRDAAPDPHTYEEVMAAVKVLTRFEKSLLRDWAVRGERIRTPLDRAYDQVRMLSESDRDRVLAYVERF